MKTLNYLFAFFFLINGVSYSQWITQINNISSVCEQGTFFLNENTGYIACWGGKIYKTTNSGISWDYQTLSGPDVLSSVYFIDSLNGFVSATMGYTFKTTNGGINWATMQSTGYSGSSNVIYFINPNTGWCIGGNSNAFVSKTTNGGTNWNIQWLSNGPYAVITLSFINSNTGYIAGGYNVFKTTNSGNNWNLNFTASNYINSIFFIDSVGFFAGYNGMIYKTTNSGNNWVSQVTGTTKLLNQVYFENVNTGYVCGFSGIVLKTINGGQNWTTQIIDTTKNLVSIYFINNLIGWCAGRIQGNNNSGIIYKTSNGGITFVNNIISNDISKYKLYDNFPNPFNPETNIKFDINKTGDTKIIIYDILGKEISVLVNKKLEKGSYSVKWNAIDKPSGIYFYKIVSEDFTDIKKMIYIK